MAKRMMLNSNSFCCCSGAGGVNRTTLVLTSASSNGRWRSVAVNAQRSNNESVGFGRTTRNKIARNVAVFGRRGKAGGRPTKPRLRDRASGSAVQQEEKFHAKRTKQEEDDNEDDAMAEAALEALFAQLEKDLEDGSMLEGEDDIEDFTEEEVMALEDELEAALLGIDFNPRITTEAKSDGDAPEAESVTQDSDSELLVDEEEQRVVSLETWQLKKLAAAAEIGRRHVNVKALAAELGMDRSDVLAWLKNPPPELLMLGASMELDEQSEDADVDEALNEAPGRTKDSGSTKENTETQVLAPVTWYSQKRLRKEHIATFERVFRRTRRPTNAMIQNLVELTHVPRKRIVEWFDQKRQEIEPSQSFDLLR